MFFEAFLFNENALYSLGFDEVAELLIQKGADVHVVGEYGQTALIYAAGKGFEKIVQMLIERDANVNIVDENNNSALTFTASKGNTTNESLFLFLKKSIEFGLLFSLFGLEFCEP